MRDRILFLDMDGVVNSNSAIVEYLNDLVDNKGMSKEDARQTYFKEFRHMTELIFPHLAHNVKRIVEEADADIVWSTTWRTILEYRNNIAGAKEMLSRRGIPGDRLIGYTPIMQYNLRRDEIREWIRKNPTKNVRRFAIVDDSSDAAYNTKRCKFFQTSVVHGLTNDIADQIIRWLKRG